MTGLGIFPEIYYLYQGLTRNKGWVGLFQISEKDRLFIPYDNQMLLEVISQCSPLLALFKKGTPLLFRLAKKRRYLDTQLKGELTDLF